MADDPRDLGRDLAMADPFMRIGQAIASVGQAVQSGDVPQSVMDAYEAVKSHLASGGKALSDASKTLVKHASEAVSQPVYAAEQTPQEAPKPAPKPSIDYSKLAAEHGGAPEVNITMTSKPGEKAPSDIEFEQIAKQFGGVPEDPTGGAGAQAPIEDWRQAVGKGQVIFSNKVLSGAAENAPLIGGAVGGAIGGVPGAAAGGAAGSLVKAAIQRPVEAITHPLETAGYAAASGLGQGALEGVGQLIPSMLSSAAQGIYRSYLKPSLSVKLAPKAEAIVNTALSEALPIAKAGSAKAQELISGLNAQVEAALDKSTGTVDLHDVADRVRMWATKAFYKPGVSTADYDSALKVADTLDKHASLGLQAGAQSVPVTLPEANATKRALQAAARPAYGAPATPANTASMVAAREMRQAIETQAPEVAGLNARESKLIDTARAINRAIGREANQYKLHGGKALVGGIVGSEETARTGDPWSSAAKGLAVTLALQPGVASRAAIVASRLGRMSSIAPTSAARIAIAAVQNHQEDSQ